LTAGPGAVQACTAKVQSGAGHIGRPRALAMPHYDTGRTIDLDRWHDTSRRGEPLWRSWCKSPTWKSIRRHRLAEEPRCRQCAIEGRTVAASQVDHIEPHLGQWLRAEAHRSHTRVDSKHTRAEAHSSRTWEGSRHTAQDSRSAGIDDASRFPRPAWPRCFLN
jgi:hypothetical protein